MDIYMFKIIRKASIGLANSLDIKLCDMNRNKLIQLNINVTIISFTL